MALLHRDCALSAKSIREALGLKDRAHVRAAYVQPALDLRLIEMTRPEKPKNRGHEYRLTDAGMALARQLSGASKAGDEPT